MVFAIAYVTAKGLVELRALAKLPLDDVIVDRSFLKIDSTAHCRA